MSNTHTRSHADTPVLEWVLGGLGLMLLVAGVWFLVAEGLQHREAGTVRVLVETVEAVQDGYHVRLGLHNLGSATLADLHVRARVLDQQRELENVQLVIDYLPALSTRKAGLFLRHDPQRYRLEVHAEGYQAP